MVEQGISAEDSRKRIGQMKASGQISPKQADMLLGGIDAHAGRAAHSESPTHKRRVSMWIIWVMVVALFVLLLAFTGSDPEVVQDVADTLNEPGTVGVMNKTLSVSIAIFVLVVVPVLIIAASYNSLVNKEEAVLTSWAQVESQFQRRADLIPVLVDTVTKYMQHERETLTEVTAQRRPDFRRLAEAVDDLALGQNAVAQALGEEEGIVENQQRMDQLAAGGAAVGETVAKLFLVAEDYPDLASSDQFLELQAQLEGTENRINVARLRFNEAVGAFNSASRRIPGNLAAGLGGFQRKAYFRAEEGSEKAPKSLFE